MNRVTTPMPGPALPGLVWVRPIGAGGFADVHLYRQVTPDRDVAVKIQREAGDASGREALTAEANAMAAVTGHPAIVALYEVGATADDRPYLVMEYCPVANLGDQVRLAPMAPSRALDTMIRISAGTEMLHRHGLVHRDIKPANIMLTAWGHPVLGDFGVALPAGAVAGATAAGFSVLWAPPEQQLVGSIAHPTQDVWALAATTWTLLTGRSPFEDPVGDNSTLGVATRVREGRIPGLGRPDVPPLLEQVLRQALVSDATQRTPSATEFGHQLRGVQEAMRLPLTPMDIRDRLVAGESRPVDTDRTRPRAMPVIDAVQTRPAAVVTDPRPEATPEPKPPAPQPTRSGAGGVRWWVAGLLVVAAVLVTVALVLPSIGTGQPTPTKAVVTANPVTLPPAAPTQLAGAVAAGQTQWTWRASTTPDVRYIATISRPGKPPLVRDTQLTGVQVEAISGENCADVVAVGKDGRASQSVNACVQVP